MISSIDDQIYFIIGLEKETPFIQQEIAIDYSSCEKAEVIYLFGVEIWHYAPLIAKKACKNNIVLMEEDLGKVKAFLSSPSFQDYLKYPVALPTQSNDIADILYHCIEQYPTSNVVFLSSKSKEGTIEEKDLLCLSTLKSMEMAESFFLDHLLDNMLNNLRGLQKAYPIWGLKNAFCNIPAIICGAGPSLLATMNELSSLKNRALLFAGGTAIGVLNHHHIFPHFQCASDPTPKERAIIKNGFSYKAPLFYELRSISKLDTLINAPQFCNVVAKENKLQEWILDRIGLSDEIKQMPAIEGTTVTSFSMDLALYMGCNPIFLAGVDLCYSNNQKYAPGAFIDQTIDLKQRQNEVSGFTKLIQHKGKMTQARWIIESEELSDKRKRNPNCEFFNLSFGGMPIEGIPNRQIGELKKNYLRKSYDLEGLIHSHICDTSPFSIGAHDEVFTLLQKSLANLKQLYIEQQHTQNAYSRYWIENEIAYSLLLEKWEKALQNKALFHYSEKEIHEKILDRIERLQTICQQGVR